MPSVTNETPRRVWMSAIVGSMASAIVGGLGIGLPLAIRGPDVFGCIFGGIFGSAACGAFLGGIAPLVVAKVREHLNKPQICKDAEDFQAEL